MKMNAKQFAVSEKSIPERGLHYLRHTEVAGNELTFVKNKRREIAVGKITFGECTIFIFSFWEY
jgi:hypothetical protein